MCAKRCKTPAPTQQFASDYESRAKQFESRVLLLGLFAIVLMVAVAIFSVSRTSKIEQSLQQVEASK